VAARAAPLRTLHVLRSDVAVQSRRRVVDAQGTKPPSDWVPGFVGNFTNRSDAAAHVSRDTDPVSTCRLLHRARLRIVHANRGSTCHAPNAQTTVPPRANIAFMGEHGNAHSFGSFGIGARLPPVLCMALFLHFCGPSLPPRRLADHLKPARRCAILPGELEAALENDNAREVERTWDLGAEETIDARVISCQTARSDCAEAASSREVFIEARLIASCRST